jgi:predicted small lipoprotein YifL
MTHDFRRALLAVLLTTAVLLSGCGKKQQEELPPADKAGTGGFRIGYQEGLTVVEDPNALQSAVDEMIEKSREAVGLEYKNEAYSSDGTNFACYIANAERNEYDMFIAIYGDEDFTDELFLSGLMRPGQAFDHLTLNHPLETGSHTVYVAFTQVEEVDGEQAIHAQVLVTMNFTVLEE